MSTQILNNENMLANASFSFWIPIYSGLSRRGRIVFVDNKYLLPATIESYMQKSYPIRNSNCLTYCMIQLWHVIISLEQICKIWLFQICYLSKVAMWKELFVCKRDTFTKYETITTQVSLNQCSYNGRWKLYWKYSVSTSPIQIWLLLLFCFGASAPKQKSSAVRFELDYVSTNHFNDVVNDIKWHQHLKCHKYQKYRMTQILHTVIWYVLLTWWTFVVKLFIFWHVSKYMIFPSIHI